MTIKPSAANREIAKRDVRSTQEMGRGAIEQKGEKLTRPC